MVTYTITLTNAEDAALSYVAASQQAWIDNAVHERCRIAIDEIVKLAVDKCLENSVQIPGTRDEIVALAFSQGWIITGAEKNAQLEETPATV